jgi:MOSC domain-containing protein YiiM
MKTGTDSPGTVRAIAVRAHPRSAMAEIPECMLIAGQGLAGETGRSRKRSVTLLSLDRWRDVRRELAGDVPWHFRRANLLVEGVDLAAAVGHVLAIGPARVRVHGETKPCALMDQMHSGLRAALVPAFRGGVYGEIIVGGFIRVGDPVVLIGDSLLPPFPDPAGVTGGWRE